MVRIKTSEMDTPALGMRSRLIKALYAAGLAEEMLGLAGAKAVGSEGVFPAQKHEILMWDYAMEIT